jgi:hypothetical protein
LLHVLRHDGALHIEIESLRFGVERKGIQLAREGLLVPQNTSLRAQVFTVAIHTKLPML